MNSYEISNIGALFKNNTYPGRGIVAGTSLDGKKAVVVYFIMGRSANSRNRVFKLKNGELFTAPFNSLLVKDPSLIIYQAVRQYGNRLIVTNGNQTDTIYDGFKAGKSFSEALASRDFEPDNPNYTPRISAVLNLTPNAYTYSMSILKSIDAAGSASARYTFDYPAVPGLGHFIHTYMCDGNPIPSFYGEPERVQIPDCIDEFTSLIWNNLNPDNKISLYVRYTDIASGAYKDRLVNKNK